MRNRDRPAADEIVSPVEREEIPGDGDKGYRMAADVTIGSPPRRLGSKSDETQNSGTRPAEAEANPYRTGYRDGFHDAQDQDDDTAADDHGSANTPDAPPKSYFRRMLPYLVGGAVLAALIVAGVLYWLNARHYESTDDAFVDAHVANISSQISGRVINVLFDDNQRVATGQTLIEIDPRDYQEKLDQARASLGTANAQLAQAKAQLALQKANLEQAMAQVTVAQADSQQASQDLARYRGVDPRAVTRQDVDKTSAAARSSQARLDASRSAVDGARAQIDAAAAQIQAAEASAREAQVNVDNSELQLSYTKIVAPVDGRVAKRNVELGTFVSPGQALLAVVPPPSEMWITANFKETQLTGMKPGDPVEIAIDTYPDIIYYGRVDSFQTGTGSAFSTLPAENATGNYVKVVQRLPVKIRFNDDRIDNVRLAPGLSVVPRVKVR
jgi:membrane fusion protein (multidrug efflux system)